MFTNPSLRRLAPALAASGLAAMALSARAQTAVRGPAQPLTRVLHSQKGGFILLEVPRRFVGNCANGPALAPGGALGNGEVRTFLGVQDLRNDAVGAILELNVSPDGSYTLLDGRKAPAPGSIPDHDIFFFRSYVCYVPVLTESQVAQLGVDADLVTGVSRWNFSQLPAGLPGAEDTDLVQSARYRDFARGRFVFQSGLSGGIDPYTKGSGIGRIIAKPGAFGLGAVYFKLEGKCGSGTGRLNTGLRSIAELDAACGVEALVNVADEVSRGVGLTYLDDVSRFLP